MGTATILNAWQNKLQTALISMCVWYRKLQNLPRKVIICAVFLEMWWKLVYTKVFQSHMETFPAEVHYLLSF